MNPDVSTWTPRSVCPRCRRPTSVCYCAHVTSIETETRIVLLQHPRERDVAIGTARMASLCLPNAELHVGVDWESSKALARALSDPARPPVLLYPGEGAIDVTEHPPTGPVTLVVVDGTWSQAKTLVRDNPRLRALPRYTFKPARPSEYRIRREPDDAYVSTIEALVYVLGALERDPERLHALLRPFRAMIDAQLDCEKKFQGARLRHPKKRVSKGPRPPPIFRERAADLVCVVGEANAWPYAATKQGHAHDDELVHWTAYRVATGETFEHVAAPRNPLAPRTTMHLALTEDELTPEGSSLEDLLIAWRAFVRDSDVVCSWGRYATQLFATTGGFLPPARVDMRQVARVYTNDKVGTLDEFVRRIGAPESPRLARGRAGMRLGQLMEIARHFAAL